MLGALALTAALCVVAQAPSEDGSTPESAAPVATLTRLPELIDAPSAPYPPAAEAARREGTVVLLLDVDADGLVQRVEVLESAGEDFDRAATAAATHFVFTPAEAGELGPVPVRITYRYAFTLSEQVETATASAPGAPAPPPPITLSGTVLEAGSRAPVAFATVELELSETATLTWATVETSTDTDAQGRFALRGVPAGQHRVKVSAPFFRTTELVETLRVGEAIEVAYFAERTEKSPYEVVVRARAPRKEVARRTLKLDEIRRVPGSQGDAIRVVQNLPGVARTPFGVGLLVVRGARPQDTGVFVDGYRIPILFHFGGLGGVTSVINSSTLEQINFQPGGFGPELGLISAGAVELVTRRAETDRVHGEAQLDTVAGVPVNVGVLVEGPLSEDPDDGAFLFSLRRSAIDGVIALVTEIFDAPFSLAPRYYDYQLRYDKPLGDSRRTFTLLAYGSDDELVLLGGGGALSNDTSNAQSTQSRTFFHRLNPRVRYAPSEATQIDVGVNLGVDFTSTEAPGAGGSGDGFRFQLVSWSAALRLDARHRLSEALALRVGGELLHFRFDTESELPAFTGVRNFPSPVSDDAPTRKDSATVPVTVMASWAELELKPVTGLTLWPGLRAQLVDYFATDQPLIDPRLVEGRSKATLEPRLTARYDTPWSRLRLKGQAGLYRQPALPQQIYLNADLPLQRVQQYSGGFELDLADRLSLDVQGFLRRGDLIAIATGAREVVDGQVRPVGFVAESEQRAYGMELLLRLEERWGLFGWIAYTLSRSEFKTPDDPWRPNFFFDQTHNFNLVAVYELGLEWHAGLRFRYVTGGGLPNTSARWYDADADGYRRQIDGQTRAPAFHQLDLYVEKRWTFDEWYLVGYLDVQNVYNRANTELFAPTFDFKGVVPIPGIPILPALGLRGVF